MRKRCLALGFLSCFPLCLPPHSARRENMGYVKKWEWRLKQIIAGNMGHVQNHFHLFLAGVGVAVKVGNGVSRHVTFMPLVGSGHRQDVLHRTPPQKWEKGWPLRDSRLVIRATLCAGRTLLTWHTNILRPGMCSVPPRPPQLPASRGFQR